MTVPRKAVIPAAGLGTRFLPATKAVPKELLPIVDIPTIQYVVQEIVDSGLSQVVLVTGRGKGAIEDHFDFSPELERFLEEKGKGDLLAVVRRIATMVQVVSVRQQQPLGLGHAVLAARPCIGNEPFAVLLGDDVFDAAVPCTRQLLDIYAAHGPVIALNAVAPDKTHLYGVIEGARVRERLHRVHSLVEKPAPGTAPTNLSVMGRYVLPPEIFDILEATPPGKGGEIQLTDGLQTLARRMPLFGLEYEGRRFDAGDKVGFVEATVAFALKRPDLARELRPILTRLLNLTPSAT
ncbi:MAG TPA: UTP--glucose-1-phosphate uridylyltransferase GalU [Candidatus Nitrosopolaris sp.]|nr:UTP--glucose-1-phosphate uridylyltransferase GalU [Candidatus Nitrosopolaris sp.]